MQSMTGFARAEKVLDGYQYTVEMKSVNHRYLDLRCRLPGPLQMYENAFTELVRSHIQRGSVELSIRQRLANDAKTLEGTTRFMVDERAAKSFESALAWIGQEFKVPALATAELMLSTGKIVLAVDEVAESKSPLAAIKKLCEEVLAALIVERKREGAETQKNLQETVQTLQTLCQEVKALAAGHPEKIRERLQKRIAQWTLTPPVDASRLETEIAFFADRADISEEIQRFEAHLAEFFKLLKIAQPVGRKLDFLTQELHRETNTIASKADDLGISRLAVEAKTAIEKLREQVQNVE